MSSRQLVFLASVIGLACWAVASAPSAAHPQVGSSLIPADVLQRSDVARINMKRIAAAMATYANNNHGVYPTDLLMLYPEIIDDPRVFWHPGDSDPAPTTIDNSVPNALNSIRISYEFAANPNALCEADPMLWDNTAANNDGLFVNRMSASGVITTDPPFITPTPTRTGIAQGNLRLLYNALWSYAAENGERFPTDPAMLSSPGRICSPQVFWHPGDADPQPTAITNSAPDAANSAQISFSFPCAGQPSWLFNWGEIMVQDNSPSNNSGRGISVIRANGQIAFISACHDPFADADGDHDVDQADFAVFQRCLNPGGMRLGDECGCFDRPESGYANGDGDLDPADFLAFQACISGPDVPANVDCD